MYEMAGAMPVPARAPRPQEQPRLPTLTSTPRPKEQPRVRVEFPETWLWSESSTGYHLTPSVIYAAEFDSLSWCFVTVIPGPSLAVFQIDIMLHFL